jgi:hypothetical protein
MFLGLSLSNTDGFVANYNVNTYLSGQTKNIDTDMLSELSDAAMPALAKLRDNAPNKKVKNMANEAIEMHGVPRDFFMLYNKATSDDWYHFNVQSYLARDIKAT